VPSPSNSPPDQEGKGSLRFPAGCGEPFVWLICPGTRRRYAPLCAVRGDRLCAVFLLSLMGLRPAEICGMRWGDVDLGGATVTVDRIRTLIGNKAMVEKETKSLAGERQLPLPELVREALAEFRATQMAEKLAVGERYEDNEYVLVDGLGRRSAGGSCVSGIHGHGRELAAPGPFVRRSRELLHVPGEQGRAGSSACPLGRVHRRPHDQALVCEAGCGGSTAGRGYVGRTGERPGPRSRSECEMWERERVSEKNVETLQYRFDGPEDAPVLVIGPSLGTTWHRL
jgi:hypothetical protein